MYLPSPRMRSEEPASGPINTSAHEPPGVAYGTFLVSHILVQVLQS